MNGWTTVRVDVTNPYNGALLATISTAQHEHVDTAVKTAADALQERLEFPQWQRAEALERAAIALREQHEQLASLIVAGAGKPLVQARVEADRAADTMAFCAAEARRLAGEVIPMEAKASGVGKIGFTRRHPLGVVAAITPFNFALNLVAHKVGPALGAGNAVLVKPAVATPLVAIALVQLLLEAGVPHPYLQLLNGSGAAIGAGLVGDERIAAISFAGSREVGSGIRAGAPRKEVLLELGSTSPVIVRTDADWERAADECALHGFSYSGQSCISVPRILVHKRLAEQFVARLVEASTRCA